MSHVDPVAELCHGPKNRSIYPLLSAWAERTPSAVAIVAPGRAPLTYGRLCLQLDDVVATLNAMGLGRNDRVAVVLPQGPELAAVFLAVAAGATCAPLNPAYRAHEFDFLLADLHAKALMIQSGMDSPVRAIAQARGLPIIELSPVSGGEAGSFTLTGERRPCPNRGGFAHPGDVALVLHTSGTTARPKIVPLTQANICTAAHNHIVTLELGERERCLNVMPLFHIHGLISAVLSSLVAGGSVVCTPGFSAPDFFEWLEAFCPTWYTAAPIIHQAVLAGAAPKREIIERRPLRFIRSAAAALPPQVMQELEQIFNAPVIESYGMTEAAAQITSNLLPPGQRKPGSVGRAAGLEVAIQDEAGHLQPQGAAGEIVIRGANVIQAYEDHPAANLSSFTDGWFRTGDQGFLDPEGYLFITGRLKELINRGGEKISPREVEEVLLDHPAVAQVVAFAVPHVRLGEDVAAAVVLGEGGSATEGELRAFTATRLADFKVPSRVLFMDEIPTGPTGKPLRIGLAETLGITVSHQPNGDPTQTNAGEIAPRTPVERALAEIWAEVLDLDHVGIHDNFFALGGHSLLATQVISRLEAAFQVELPLRRLFETPTIAEFALAVEEAQANGTALQVTTVAPVAREAYGMQRSALGETDGRGHEEVCVFPASFAQQQLWFLAQFAPESPAYNIPAAYHLSGPLNGPALEQSLSEIVRRHEALRTTFAAVDGQLVQVVAPHRPLQLPVVDLRGLPDEEKEAQAMQLATEDVHSPFDLAQGPLFRATLAQLTEEHYVLLLNVHHVIFDGWSMQILLEELTALYRAFSAGKPSPLPELPMQYADYAVWQRQWLQGEILEKQLSYWQQHLGGSPSMLALPTDRPRPAVQTYRGARQSRLLSKPLSDALRAVSQREGVTLFMTLLAAFQTLLHRYTGRDDITVGSPIANRTRAELEGLIGFFVNTLVLRTDLSGNPTFQELLRRVREVALGAYAHQDLPFEKLVEELQPERQLSHPPLFQVTFSLQHAPRQALHLPSLTLAPLPVDSGTAKFELTLSLVEAASGLVVLWEYNTDLFDAATITRMGGHFQTLLKGIVADPTQRLSELPVLPRAERRQLLVEWNSTTTDYPQHRSLPQLFAAQVTRTPDATAVVFGDQQLTYRELNAQANRLAYRLHKLGIGPEALVAICLERSLELVVGLLGTLKAGGAYVPLDPAYPMERLAFMMADTQASVLLTQKRLLARLPAHNAHVICLDTDWEAIVQEPTESPGSEVATENPAYVIYTSGSTGRPKGTMITHRALCNHMAWMQQDFPLTEADRVLQRTPFSFDASVWEFYAPLLAGAQLVLAQPGGPLDGGDLVKLIAEQRITILQLVPSLLRMLLREQGLKTCTSLRRVFCGGEALDIELTERFFSCLPAASLHNLYGPTEATIDVTSWTCKRESHRRTVPIGRPIANTQIYVLNPQLQLVPIGVPGELYVGGEGLARGYLNRPELTAEKLIPNPFSLTPGRRLYKTGDLARWLSDGHLEFLGRLDHQVKLRGFRLELGEIEAVLSQHPAVREAVVVAREDVPGDRRLAAYVVAAQEPALSSRDLRAFLQAQLPHYMVPAAFVRLETLPLTPNGKVDRRALPAPDQARPTLGDALVAPRTPVEAVLAGIWADVLGLPRVGIHENFFELGGHSLLATQVMSRLQATFQVEVALRHLFEAPTVAELAQAIIAQEARPGQTEKIAHILKRIEGMSAEDRTNILQKKSQERGHK